VFPDIWPTYRQLWSLGNSAQDKGFDGLWYRYGPDNLVATDCLSQNCPDKVWRWVNQQPTSQKRNLDDEIKDHPLVRRNNDQFKKKVRDGLTKREALTEIAMEECNSIEKQKVSDELLQWIEMNSGDLAEYDRICDTADAITEKKEDKPSEAITTNTAAEVSNGQSLTPVWVIVVASVASVIGVIIIVVVVIVIVKKRNAAAQANLYVQM